MLLVTKDLSFPTFQADVIPTDLKCDKFHQVLGYWRTRCLPPTTHGTISVFGILPVRDVTYYLQYYSIPIATVLFTPVLKLLVALMTVYNTSSYTPEKSHIAMKTDVR